MFSENASMLEQEYARRRCVIYRGRFLRGSLRLPLCLFAAALIACLAACGGNSTTTPPGPPTGTQHLYTAGGAARALQFALPLTSTSPAAILSNPATNGVYSVAVDPAGNVADGDFAGNITIFNGPVTGSASASATFKNGTAIAVDQLVFNSAGDLFFTNNNAQSIGELPHSGGSVTLHLSVPAGSDARDIAVGPGDRVLVSARFGNTIYMLTTGAPVPLAGRLSFGLGGREVLVRVAAIFCPIFPDLPMPATITFPRRRRTSVSK